MRTLASLWPRYESNLRGFARRLTRNTEDAEDLLGDTAARVAEKFHLYDPEWAFDSWAIAVMKHEFTNRRRKAQRSPETVSFHELSDPASGCDYDPLDHAPLPDEIAIQEDEARRALAGVSRSMRPVFVLMAGGESISEIARKAGEPSYKLSRLIARERFRAGQNLLRAS